LRLSFQHLEFSFDDSIGRADFFLFVLGFLNLPKSIRVRDTGLHAIYLMIIKRFCCLRLLSLLLSLRLEKITILCCRRRSKSQARSPQFKWLLSRLSERRLGLIPKNIRSGVILLGEDISASRRLWIEYTSALLVVLRKLDRLENSLSWFELILLIALTLRSKRIPYL
jgi:hypothetical protein